MAKRISSPGRRSPKRHKDRAWVPEAICWRTSALSVPKTLAYTSSVTSLPRSSYPYPVAPAKSWSLIPADLKALSTFMKLYFSLLSIRRRLSLSKSRLASNSLLSSGSRSKLVSQYNVLLLLSKISSSRRHSTSSFIRRTAQESYHPERVVSLLPLRISCTCPFPR